MKLRVLVIRGSTSKVSFEDCEYCTFQEASSIEEAVSLANNGYADVLLLDHAHVSSKIYGISAALEKPVALFIYNVDDKNVQMTFMRNFVSDIIWNFPKGDHPGRFIYKVWEQYFSGKLDRVLEAAQSAANAFAVVS